MTAIPIETAIWNLRAVGLRLEDLAEATSLPLLSLRSVTYAQSVELWGAAERVLNDPLVGHRCGTRLRVVDTGVLGSVVASAPSVRLGLERFARVASAVLPGTLRIELVEGGARTTYERPSLPTRTRHGVESLLASLVGSLRYCASRSFPVRAVGFDHQAPSAGLAEYEAFYGSRVRWNEPASYFELDDAFLDLPLASADAALSDLLRDYQHDQRVSGTPELVRRVEQAILQGLASGDTTAGGVADRLGMSPRTLGRRLQSVGDTFGVVRARTLFAQAEMWLQEERWSVEEVGRRCGFRSRAGFERAFRQWSGLTPAAYRRSLSRREESTAAPEV